MPDTDRELLQAAAPMTEAERLAMALDSVVGKYPHLLSGTMLTQAAAELRRLGAEVERLKPPEPAVQSPELEPPELKSLGDAADAAGLSGRKLPTIPIAACNVGDYVLATKYHDGDPGDRWAVGFYAGMERDRHMVKDSAGKQIHAGGYRGVIRIPLDVGDWLLKNARVLESSPGGAVNLLQMVATQFNADRIEEEQE